MVWLSTGVSTPTTHFTGNDRLWWVFFLLIVGLVLWLIIAPIWKEKEWLSPVGFGFILAAVLLYLGPWIISTAEYGDRCINSTGQCIRTYRDGGTINLRPNHREEVILAGTVKMLVPVGYKPHTDTRTRIVKDLGHTIWFAPCNGRSVQTVIRALPLNAAAPGSSSC